MNHPKFIVVVGASSGGLNALSEMVNHLPDSADAAYCIVLHLSRKAVGDYVVNILQKSTKLPCSLAVNDETIKRNHIYIARPNQHLLVKEGKFLLGAGPQENRWRPSIDVLFRSAAVAYSSHVIGVILSGQLDDGTSGMWAIKRSGGACIVQDPAEAEYADMPKSVLNNMEVDYISRLAEIGTVITKIIDTTKREKTNAPEEVVIESEIAEKTAIGIDDIRKLTLARSSYACPDCGGGLWEVNNDVVKRYRCHIGHAYTEKDLIVRQAESAVTTLWVALRMMEERKHLLRKMEVENKERGIKAMTEGNVEKQAELEGHIKKLKDILFDLQNHESA